MTSSPFTAVAAGAKSLQSCPTPCDPIDCSPPGSPVPGILQARTLEWAAISLSTSPFTLWQIEREKVELVTDFLFLGSKIPVDGDWSHEIRRWLFLGRKLMKNLDSVLKSRGFANKGPYSQGYVLHSGHIHLWELNHKEGGAPKNYVFKLWCWRNSWKSLGQQGDQTNQS